MRTLTIALLLPAALVAAPAPGPTQPPASIDGEWVLLWAGSSYRLLLTPDGRYRCWGDGDLGWAGEYTYDPRTGLLTVREAVRGHAGPERVTWSVRLNGRPCGKAVYVGGSAWVELQRVGGPR